jgi:acetylornithine deacetylase/succinyl-diaminopimelate desuccinylase-like protein
VLEVLGDYHLEIARQTHPLLASPSCTPTIIRSGIKENAVPDYCEITVDRRLLPGETVEGELNELARRLRQITAGDPEFEFELTTPKYSFAPAEIPSDSLFAQRVSETVAAPQPRGELGELGERGPERSRLLIPAATTGARNPDGRHDIVAMHVESRAPLHDHVHHLLPSDDG